MQFDGDLAKDLEELKDSADQYALDAGLDGAIAKLSGPTDGEEEEEDEADDGAQEDGAAGGPSQHPGVSKSASAVGRTAATPQIVD